MTRIYESITELIGNTPLIRINRLQADRKAEILAKIEYFNPGGSVKDRIAYQMIMEAKRDKKLDESTVLIEPTSGNTGIGLAMTAAALGIRLIIVLPETMSIERRKLIRGYGAELVLTEGSKGMKGAIAKAEELHKEIPNSIILQQFENENNLKAHLLHTGEEIWRDTEGTVDVFIAGVGTGGTISGTAAYLKKKNPAIRIVAVEPENSPVLSGGSAGPHKIQGIGAGFIPRNYHAELVDEIVQIRDEEAVSTAKRLAREEGIAVGISSGAAMCAALKLAEKEEYAGKRIVVLLPDTAERYLSTVLYEEEGIERI
ncbi:cysteine synthase A [[Clostridium] innocuum]|nr:cysteine synthase A [[Clostridium] innocuum]